MGHAFTDQSADAIEEAFSESIASGSSWRRANCPFCVERGEPKPDTHQSWGLNTDTGYWHCFRCGAKGVSAAHAQGDAAGFGALSKLEQAFKPKPAGAASAHDGPAPLHPDTFMGPPETWTPLESDDGQGLVFLRARAYMASRKIEPATIAAAQVGSCYRGLFRDRIVVPVLSRRSDQWLGFVGRTWYNAAETKAAEEASRKRGYEFLRYRYPRWPTRGMCLFNERALDAKSDRPVMVVEGVFDALPYWPDVVACLGKPTHDQVRILSQSRRPIVMCLDGDAWEQSYMTALEVGFAGVRTGFVRLPPREDPCSVDREWLRGEADKCPTP